jgi:hypothetical protein
MKKVAGQEKNSEKQKGKKEKLKMVPSFILSPLEVEGEPNAHARGNPGSHSHRLAIIATREAHTSYKPQTQYKIWCSNMDG